MPKRKKRGGPGRPKAAPAAVPTDDSAAGHARRRSSAGGGGGSVDSTQHPPASCPDYGPGWTVQVIPRKGGGRKAVDRLYRAPDGRKFRSAREVERFLAAVGEAKAVAPAAAAAAAGGGDAKEAVDEGKAAAANSTGAAAEEATNNEAADAVQDEAPEDAKDDDDEEEDKPLDSPSTNIRMRVKMSSFDILGVDAVPLGAGGSSVEEGNMAKDDDVGTAKAATTAGKGPVKKHVTKSGEALFDDSDSSSSSDDEEEENKDRGANDGKPTAAEAAVAPTHQESLFDAFGGSDDEEDDDLLGLEPSPKDDDSAYTESNNGGDDDSEDLDDDAEDYEEEEKGKPRARSSGNRGGGGAPSSPRQTQWKNSLVNKRVRVISGYWKGKTGTVVENHYGWYTLDPASGVNTAVRAKELEVLDDDNNNESTHKDQEEARDDLIGATVRVRGGNYAGMEGTVNEVMRYRHVQIDALPDQLVHLSHVELLSPPPPPHEGTAHVEANEGSTTEADLTATFQGARVRIAAPHDKAGTEGIAAKVVVGQWYVMDNPDVKVAQRDHNLEVVAWRADVAARKAQRGAVEEGSGGGGGGAEDTEGTAAANEGDAPNKDDERPHTPKPTRKQEKLAAQWNEKYALLVEHKRAHGTANMPCTHKTDDGVALGKWLENQKSLCAANKLLVERYERLREVGVTFNTVGPRYDDATAGEPESPAEAASSFDPDVETVPHNESTKEAGTDGERVDSGAGDKKPAANPLLGATVYVGRGAFQGLQGKIAIIHSRGWWTLDNPLVTGKVKCADCRFIDDGTYDLGAIEDWYDVAGRARMPRVVQPGREGAGAKSILRENSAGGDDVRGEGQSTMFKRKIDETDFTGGDLAKRRKELGVVAGGVPSNDGRGSQRPRTHRPKTRGGNAPALNPILVQPRDDSPGTEARLKLQLLPEGLRHLPLDAKVEIFNRRTGRIMKGDQAILLSDLPAALMDHAEFEPIVPPPPNSSVSTRIGRSGPNVRVNRNVVPQTRVRGSKVEGRSVLVTGGEYRGLSGTIDSCIPGGWYLVSGLFRAGDSIDAVINSKHLELIPKKISIRDSTPSEARSMKRTRIHLKAAKLRLEALLEEQTKLENSGDAPHVQLSEVDLHVNRARKRVADLERNLAKIVSDELRSSMEQKLKEAKTNEPEVPPKALAPGGGAVRC